MRYGGDFHDERGINLADPIADDDAANKLWTEEQIAAQSRLKGTYTPDTDGLGTPLPDLDALVAGVDVLTADFWTVDLSGRPQSGPFEVVDLNADDRLVANIGPNAVGGLTLNPSTPAGLLPNTKVRFEPEDPAYTGKGQGLGLVLTTDATGTTASFRLANRGLGYEAGEVLNATIPNNYLNTASVVTFTSAPGWVLSPNTTYYDVALTNVIGAGQGLIVNMRTDAAGTAIMAVDINDGGLNYAAADTLNVEILGTPIGTLTIDAVHSGTDIPCEVTVGAVTTATGWNLIRGAGLTRAQANKDYLRLDGGNEPTKAINWGNQQIKELADPIEPQDAVNFRTLNQGVSALGIVVTVPGHTFTTGQAVYLAATGTWTLAQADDSLTLNQGLVVVTGPDTFSVILEGRMVWPAHGFFAGTRLFLSQTVAGTLEPTEQNGGLIQFCAEVLDADTLFVRDQAVYERGPNDLNVIGSSVPASTLIPANQVGYTDTASAPEIAGTDVQSALDSAAVAIRANQNPAVPGYFNKSLTGLVVNDFVQVCVIKKFFSGQLFIATNQSGNAPQITIDIMHPYTVSKCHVSYKVRSNQNTPWDQIRIVAAGGNDSGGDAEVWLRWGAISSPDADISLTFVGAAADESEPVTWADPPLVSATPGTAAKTVTITSGDESYLQGFKGPSLPASITIFRNNDDNVTIGAGTKMVWTGFNVVTVDPNAVSVITADIPNGRARALVPGTWVVSATAHQSGDSRRLGIHIGGALQIEMESTSEVSVTRTAHAARTVVANAVAQLYNPGTGAANWRRISATFTFYPTN